MNKSKLTAMLALGVSGLVSLLPAQEAPQQLPSQEEMWQMIQMQQKQIEALSALVESNQQKVESTESEIVSVKANADTAVAESKQTKQALESTQAQLDATTLAVEESGSSSLGWWDKTSIGGYGELHANFFEDSASNEIDFHRFVLFFNHEFNDWISLYSEVEIEHTSISDTDDGSSGGEVKLEQAFVQLNWNEQSSTDVGLFLMPVGILNDYHEPTTFYGVERNDVEANIIPTTWFEGGVRQTHRFANGLSLEGGITSGLNVGDDFRIRSGRQDVSKAPAEEPGFVTRARYTGISGLELAASFFYQDDLAQEADTDFSGLLSTAHAVYSFEGFTLKALYAQWNLNGDDVPGDAERQFGWYLEPSYRWSLSEQYGDLGIFARYSDYEYYNNSQRENEVLALGVNWWPTDNVVLKADFEQYDNGSDDNGRDNDHSVNLGVGYQF